VLRRLAFLQDVFELGTVLGLRSVWQFGRIVILRLLSYPLSSQIGGRRSGMDQWDRLRRQRVWNLGSMLTTYDLDGRGSYEKTYGCLAP